MTVCRLLLPIKTVSKTTIGIIQSAPKMALCCFACRLSSSTITFTLGFGYGVSEMIALDAFAARVQGHSI